MILLLDLIPLTVSLLQQEFKEKQIILSNVPLKSGNNYNLARVQDKTIIIGSDDHSHAIRTIDQQLLISGSSVPVTAASIHVGNSGNVTIIREQGTGLNPMLKLENSVANGACSMTFVGDNTWTIGTRNDTTVNDRYFQIRDNTVLSAAPTTNSEVAIAFGPRIGVGAASSMSIFLPSFPTGTGNTVKYDTTTNELTYDASSQKIKKNIVSPSASIYDNILSLQPKYFERKDTSDNKQYLGFIAEETAVISNKFVTLGPDWAFNENGFLRHDDLLSNDQVPIDIDDRAIIAALVGKIQDLESRLKQLENK